MTTAAVRTAKAWDLIGFGEDGQGHVRLVGGRALYEEVAYQDDTPGIQVRLGRVDTGPRGLRAVVRYVDPDTLLEVLP